MTELTVHPLAEAFPQIEGSDFDEFVEDIRAHGVREPITIYEGQILDGRNRYRAAREVGVECPIAEYNGSDPIGFVISLNIRRRHLKPSQRSMVAGHLANLKKGQTKAVADRQTCPSEPAPVTNKEAADLLNVSERSVKSARSVMEEGAPNVVQAVKEGEVSVSAAAKAVKAVPKEEQAAWTDVKAEVQEVVKAEKQEEPEEQDGEEEKVAEAEPIRPPSQPTDEKASKIRRLQADVRGLKGEKARLAEKLKAEKLWNRLYKAQLAWAWEWADELERRMGLLSEGDATPQPGRVLDVPVDDMRMMKAAFYSSLRCPIGPIDETRVKALAESIEKGEAKEPVLVRRDWRFEEHKRIKIWVVVGDPHLFEAYKSLDRETVPCVLAAGLGGLRADLAFAEACLAAGNACEEQRHEAACVRRNTKEELSKRTKALGIAAPATKAKEPNA